MILRKKCLSALYKGWRLCDQGLPYTCSDQAFPKPFLEQTQTQPLSLFNELFIGRFQSTYLWKLCQWKQRWHYSKETTQDLHGSLYFDLALQLPLKHVAPGLKWHPHQHLTVSAISSPGKLSPSAELWSTNQDFAPGFTAPNYTCLTEWRWLWPSNALASISELGKNFN